MDQATLIIATMQNLQINNFYTMPLQAQLLQTHFYHRLNRLTALKLALLEFRGAELLQLTLPLTTIGLHLLHRFMVLLP